jgi:hypothetical protein
MNLYAETDIISENRNGRLRRVGHTERISEERTLKKVFKDIPERKRSVGKPRKKRLDDENHLKKMGVRN